MAHFALFVPSFHGGGAEKMMVHLANHWADEGHVVDFLVVNAAGPYRGLLGAKIRLVDLGRQRALSALPGLVTYLGRSRPDALVSALTLANVLAVLAGRLSRSATRIVVSERNHLSSAIKRGASRHRLLPRLARLCYPRANTIVAISAGVADDVAAFTGLPRDRIEVIYNPVVSEELLARIEAQPADPNSESQAPIVGIGRLVPQKDFATLVRAYRKIADRTDAPLVILGEGEQRGMLEELVSELDLQNRVSLPGFVEDPQNYLGRAGCFVLSSRWEGFGNVIVEALAAGCPVVCTDCPSGPAEILQHGEFGRLVEPRDQEGMAEAIMATLAAPLDPVKLKRRADDFRVGPIAERYLSLMLGE